MGNLEISFLKKRSFKRSVLITRSVSGGKVNLGNMKKQFSVE